LAQIDTLVRSGVILAQHGSGTDVQPSADDCVTTFYGLLADFFLSGAEGPVNQLAEVLAQILSTSY
jgi:hypothetical protein